MKIIKMVGRLGNQMFIYAFAKAFEYYTGEKVCFDVSEYKDNAPEIVSMFDVKFDVAPWYYSAFYNFLNSHKKLFKCLIKHFIVKEECENCYQPSLFDNKSNAIFYFGYFQCEDYFKEIKGIIRRDFKFKHFDSPELIKLRAEIESFECPIFVNVRRGDYVALAKQGVVQWLCDVSYYQKATKIMREKYPNCTFIAISDEPDWLKENLKIDYPFKIYSSPLPTYDIYLLQSCKHAICANSSYSWWGAWLIDNPDKTVIAPTPWFQPNQPADIIPDNWIKIPRNSELQ